jgi:2-aminoethylphosphonate-pyruvate transaminase
MQRLGFQPLLPADRQSPIITAFLYPTHTEWSFNAFYAALKSRGFVIYPGKVTDHDTFRIGNIGDVHAEDMRRLIAAVEGVMAPRQDGKHPCTKEKPDSDAINTQVTI